MNKGEKHLQFPKEKTICHHLHTHVPPSLYREQTWQSLEADTLEVMSRGEFGKGEGGHCHYKNRTEKMSRAKDDVYESLRSKGFWGAEKESAPGG